MNDMKQIKHHLTGPLLMGYAAGTLPEAFNLVVATHITMCDTCRAALAEYDALGGEVMMDSDPADVAEDALAATMAMIDGGTVAEKPAPVRMQNSVFPGPLQDYVSGDIDSFRELGAALLGPELDRTERWPLTN